MDSMRKFNETLIEEYRAHGGKLSGQLANSHILLLTTTGTRSGRPHTIPLGYGMDGKRYVAVAANAGAPDHPDWYHNLRTHPDVVIELGSERFPARAWIAEGVERERILARQAEIVPWFTAQQEKTARVIPVVVFERAG